MSDLVTTLSQQAQTLHPADRARLAEMLLDSIHQGGDSEVDQGTAKLISAEDAFAQVRRALP